MSVVTQICSKVAIIDNGILVEQDTVDKVFESPKTDAAKELIFEKKVRYSPVATLHASKTIRIIFHENSSYEPVIANLILQFQTPVNILKADTRNVGGKARGEILLGLPESESLQNDMIRSLQESGLTVTEVNEDV